MMGAGQANADLPGGNNMYSAYVYVTDHQGNYAAGVDVWLQVTTWYGDEIDPELYYSADFATTDSYGFAYLECLVPPEYSDGLWLMTAYMQDPDYTLLSAQNTSTGTWATISPSFEVLYDPNQNGVYENWEMPLAQKFCPVLFAPIEDRGLLFGGGLTTLRPVPVEIMDTDGPAGQPDGKLDYHDVYVEVTNIAGQFVGEWEMEELTVAGLPYSSFYPDRIHPNHKILSFTPPGHASGTYFLRPHYEWAFNNLPEDNDVWYAIWEQTYNGNPQNSLIRDGTIYVSFLISGTDIIIEYRMHYPFNVAPGRHEGDWPTIKITVNSQNPDLAQIVSVSYPFHGQRTVRNNAIAYNEIFAETFYQQVYYEEGENHAYGASYFVINNSHPVSFAGGLIEELGLSGWGSHAQYPLIGTWIREETVFQVEIEEYVVTGGSISTETIQINFNNYQNIVIVPPKSYVVSNLIDDTNFNWLVFGGFWGHRRSLPTAMIGSVELENIAPLSPYRGTVAANEIRF